MRKLIVFIVGLSCVLTEAHVAAQSGVIQRSNFGLQCGIGSTANCQNPNSPPLMAWPNEARGGLLRLHDSNIFWSQLNPSNGTYYWTVLDQWLDLIAQHKPMMVAYQFSWVPCWDGATCTGNAQGTGTTAVPKDLTSSGSASFNSFVTTFVNHCSAAGNCVKDLIQYYQMWNEWDLSWAGTVTQLYQMIGPAVGIVRANVNGAVILMPSTTPAEPNFRCNFIAQLNLDATAGPGGKRLSDWIDFHLYLTKSTTSTNTPEQQWINYVANGVNGYLDIRGGAAVNGCSPGPTSAAGWSSVPWVNSEFNFNSSTALPYVCPNAAETGFGQYTQADCGGQIVRSQVIHDSYGAAGLWWYNWRLTVGGKAAYDPIYNEAMAKLVGGRFSGRASYGTRGGIQTWTAPFVTAKNMTALFVWTPAGNGTSYTVPNGYTTYVDSKGLSHAVTEGQSIAIGVQPLMLVKGYTRHGKRGSSSDQHTRIGGASRGICGPPNYCAYTGMEIAPLPSVPDMGGVLKNGRVFYDSSLPSASPSPVVRCTDQAIEPGITIANQSKSAGLGGSGDAEQLFNTTSTLLRFNTSGNQGHITLFNPTTMVCGDPVTGHTITADKNGTNPGSASTGYNFGAGSFSWTDPEVYFGFGSGYDAPANGVAKYRIDTTTGRFTVETPYLDFANGVPIGNLAPAWQPNHGYATGDYVSYTLALSDWSGTAAYAQGDLILPQTNNPLHCAFKLSTSGTRGTPPSSWSLTGDGACMAAQTKTEGGGTAVWRNIGNSGAFTYQLTSEGGTSGSVAPNFATGSGHPDLLSTVSDATLTWTNTGTMLAPRWKSFAGVSKDSSRFCSAFSSNAYGHPSHYDLDNGGQGTGIYVGCYDFGLNQFVLLNTATGIQSKTSCSGGTGYACTGGTLSKLTAAGEAYAAITSNCHFEVHNAKGGSTLDYVVVAKQGNLGGSCNGQNLLAWQPFAEFDSSNLQIYNALSNHWTIGKKLFVNVGDQSQLGYTSGAYTAVLDSANPRMAPKTSWQAGPPYTSACELEAVWNAGDAKLPCNFSQAYDSHTAFWHGPLDDDTGPVCGTMYNYATLAPDPVAPYQGEEVCISTQPNWNLGDPIGRYKVWRFTHTFATGGNGFFDTQFAISQLSQDGKFLAFSSDWNCTLGSTAGTADSVCGPPWVAGTSYAAGQMINPFGATTGSGTNYGVYQVSTGGVASSTRPAWFVCNSSTAGNTVTDSNGVVYTCLGSNNGKGEVFVVGLK